ISICYLLSLHDALPIYIMPHIQKLFFALNAITFFLVGPDRGFRPLSGYFFGLRFCTSVNSKLSSPIVKAICLSLLVICRLSIERSEEHTSELQSRFDIV